MIDDIAIDFLSSGNFANIEDIRKKKCNSTVDLSKFTSNKKILCEVVVLVYNQICCQTLSLKKNVKGIVVKVFFFFFYKLPKTLEKYIIFYSILS